METIRIPVRTALMPLFYKDFRCLAAACQHNCCGNWEIALTKKDYLKLKNAAKSRELQSALSDGLSRLRDGAHDGWYARFAMGPEGGCVFQTEEGLCRLQLEGHGEHLPEVCRVYPRRCAYTQAAQELSLNSSCEAVLALLWDLPQGIDFLEEDLPREEWRTVVVGPRLARFADIRSLCIDVLQERSLPLSRRMLLLGLLIQRLRDQDWTAEDAVDAWLAEGGEQLRSPSTAAVLEEISRDPVEFLIKNFRFLAKLYDINSVNRGLCRQLLAAISSDGEAWEERDPERFSLDPARYEALSGQLDALLGHTDGFFENLMVLTAFNLFFPTLLDPEKLWRSYAELCMLYGFFRFTAVCGCGEGVSRERLLYVLSTVSRGLLHNDGNREALLEILLAQGGSLANLAVLTGG